MDLSEVAAYVLLIVWPLRLHLLDRLKWIHLFQ